MIHDQRVPARRVALGIGSSLGARRATVERALARLHQTEGLELLRASRWYRTPPMRGGTALGWFINGVALFRTTLTPLDLLSVCRDLETKEGRRRSRYWGDRTLDIDVLLIEGVALHTRELTVPHPAVAQRPFVVGPLLEIWPDAIDPTTGRPIRETPSTKVPRPVTIGVVARPRTSVTAGPL